MIYFNFCDGYRKKCEVPKRRLVVKLLVLREINFTGQVGLTDMQSQADGEFKMFLAYQDRLTLCSITTLKAKRAEELL
jgi:hypothetical protein